jgi:hypothetical protein
MWITSGSPVGAIGERIGSSLISLRARRLPKANAGA